MNWGEIKTVVRQYLENEEVTFQANLPLYARLAEEDIYRKVQLPVSRETATTNFNATDPLLSLPTDSMSVYSLAVTTPEFTYLSMKDEAFLREAYPDPTQVGVPRFFAVRDEANLLVAPTPGSNYSVQMHYFKKPVSIGLNDNALNENWLSKNAENALIFGIIMHGYIYEKGDQDVIASYKAQFETALGDLKQIVEGRQKKDTYRNPDQRLPA
jgi:hypothetical protein